MSKFEQEVQELEVELKVNDVKPSENKALQDAEANNETSEITLYVNGENMTIEDKISEGIRILKEQGTLEQGDLVVLAGGAKILPQEGENKVVGGFVRI